MKNLIFIVLFAISALAAQGQSATNQEVKTWGQPFKVTAPAPQELKAFEDRGMQKIRDFYDFIAIAGNKTYDTAMRSKARSQALALFSSGQAIIVSDAKKMTAADFTSGIYNMKKTLPSLTGNLVITSHFQVQKDGSYIAETEYNELTGHKTTKKHARIILIKTEKSFGGRKELIWTVLIDEIK